MRRVRVLKRIEDFTQPLFAYARRTSSDSKPSPERVEADVYLVAADGEVLVAMEGAQVQRLGRSGAADSTIDTSRWLYEIAWREDRCRLTRVRRTDWQRPNRWATNG